MEGRAVLVTGGARGIGRGMAEAFLAAGARVMVADLGATAHDLTLALMGARVSRMRRQAGKGGDFLAVHFA